MTDTTEQNVNQAIDWLQKTSGTIQDFAVEQAPIYCKEVISWYIFDGVIAVVLSFPLFLVSAFLYKRSRNLAQNKKESSIGDEGAAHFVFGFIVFVGAFIALASGVSSIVKAATAPRIIIIEHLKGLSK